MKFGFFHTIACFVLLGLVAGCPNRAAKDASGKPTTQSDTSKQPEPIKADPALVKSLEKAFRDFHNGMVSDDKAEHAKAAAGWIGNRSDVNGLYSKFPSAPGLFAQSLVMMLEGDVEQMAAKEKQVGDIKSLEVVDLRIGSVPGYRSGEVVRITPADVPVFLLRVQYEKEARPTIFAPILQVNGRWAWMPGLEQMAPMFKEPATGK